MSFLRSIPWTRQPPHPVPIDWGNPLTRGLKRVVVPTSNSELVTGEALTIDAATVNRSTGKGGKSYFSNTATASTGISFSKWTNTTTAGSAVIVQKRKGTGDNEWLELGKFDTADHFTFGGVVYSDPFWNGRWINGVSIPTGKLVTDLHTIGLSVIDGAQIATWDGAPWHTNTLTLSFVMPATLRFLASVTNGFDGDMYGVFLWERALSAAELKKIGQNPWQMFVPQKRMLVSPAPAAAASGVFDIFGSGIIAGVAQ